MRRHLHRSKRRLLSLKAWRVRLALWGGALLVGFAAVFLAGSSELASALFDRLIETSPYIALLISPFGLVFVAWLTRRFFPGSQGSGIPQTLAALEARSSDRLREAVLSLRVAIGKVLLTLVGLLSGASIGREGPTVHIGAAILFSMGRVMRFPPHFMERALILSGGAAGIAAAFNTPLAGVVFAIEELYRSFEERTNGIVLSAVIFSGMTALAVLGNYNYFGSTSAKLELFSDWLAVPVCGLLGGLLGGLFSQTLISTSRALAPFHRKHPLKLAAICGLVVAIIGILSGGLTYGTGYHEAKALITGGELTDPAYPLLKIMATITSYLSGIPGGIFAPSLATGAGLGANLAAWFPTAPTAAIVILGMVGYFSGVVQTPITAFVIVMEMTDNHGMLLPLMAAAFIGYGASRLVCPEPIYRALARAFLASPLNADQSRTQGSEKASEKSRRTMPESDT